MRHRMLLVWTIGFITGILLQTADNGLTLVWLGLGAAGFCLLLGSHRIWAAAMVGMALTGVAAGAVRLYLAQTVPVSDVSHLAGQLAPMTLIGSVGSDPELHPGGRVTLFLQAQQVQQYGIMKHVAGVAYVSLATESLVGVPVPDYGDKLVLRGQLNTPAGPTNPGAFSWRDYLARRGVWCELDVKRPAAIHVEPGSALNPALRLAWTIRRRILLAVQTALTPTQAAVLSGILFGQRTEFPPDLMADFVHTGTVHILASAGLHVGVVAFWALWLCERLTLPRKASALCVIGTLCLYALMAGGRPSVTRAVLMAVIYFGALLFEREPDLPTTLGAAALFILLQQPTALFEAGFQMSFLTVLTLAFAMPLWQSFWRPKVDTAFTNRPLRKAVWWMVEMAGLSLLAQIGSMPIVALDYNEVSLTGLIANILVVPTLFLVIPIGILGAMLWNVWPAAGSVTLHVAGYGLTYIASVVQSLGNSDWAYRAVAAPTWGMILTYYAVVFGLCSWISRVVYSNSCASALDNSVDAPNGVAVERSSAA